MSATTEDRGLSHPAARAFHALHSAAQIALGHARFEPLDVATTEECTAVSQGLVSLLGDAMVDLATLYQQNEANLRYIERLEAAESKHLLKVADLKTRLARAAEENEELYRLTNHEVGDATTRHLTVTRIRALLDLDTPLPPRKPVAISNPTPYGAPRAAASH